MPIEELGREFLIFATGFLCGGAVPVYYFEERLRGLGRYLAAKLPYEPPAGLSEDEAMQSASRAAGETGELEDAPQGSEADRAP